MTSVARLTCIVVAVTALYLSPASAGDWPFWRYDAQRSAASPDELPAKLQMSWSVKLPKLVAAWPDQPRLQFDVCYEPVVAGQHLVIGSSFDDSVTAYDTRNGVERWRYSAGGPVRFAPLIWKEKVFFVADDGYLTCLNINDGSLVWRYRGGPSEQKVLGNGRLISMWPARGAPVIEDGQIYFAAGIWPFMGIFIHGLDAQTGELLWTNDGDGSRYMKQPHNSDSFGGVAPQGPLVINGKQLLIPGGRSVPASYDRHTGKMRYYQLADNGKRGGWNVSATDKFILNAGAIFDVESEKYLASCGDLTCFAEGRLYEYGNRRLSERDLTTAGAKIHTTIDRKGETAKETKWSMDELGSVETPRLTALIKAGDRLFAGSTHQLQAFDLPLKGNPSASWQAEISGTPCSLIAADDRLFVVTLEGELHCFAREAQIPEQPAQDKPLAKLRVDAGAEAAARGILDHVKVREGHCLYIGAGSPSTILALAEQSDLQIAVVEPHRESAAKLRENLRKASFGANRVAVIEGDPQAVQLPPYFASVIVVSELPSQETERVSLITKLLNCLRPYGGKAIFAATPEQAEIIPASLKSSSLANAVWNYADDRLTLVREGALPGSANWTHEHADAANTRVSKDRIVKAPLGLLWFGGSSNEGILPRHGHGPQPQVADGRLFIEGVDSLRATDIYTGRLLWEVTIPGLGKLFDNTAHQPGANASGTNYIATSDGIYVAHDEKCSKLDPATGKTLKQFQLPAAGDTKRPPLWGYLNVAGDYLVGGADPVFDAQYLKGASKVTASSGDDDDDDDGKKTKANTSKVVAAVAKEVFKVENDNYSSSGRIVVMERNTGEVLWSATAQSGFRHNAICIGGGRLYCIDRLSAAQVSRLKRRGEEPSHPPRLIVFDLQTGNEIWSTSKDVFGTWLSYSEERDVLVESGRTARDTLTDEPKGMRAYRGSSGDVLWTEKGHAGPAMIHHDTILMAGNACDLLTGAKRTRLHPLSGEPVEWTWSRNYGCNTPLASEHLLTFRSGAAGYLDFCNDGGTGNFGGFRSSCTNNLIVAGGVLSAPDYTRTCTCSYQNQCSLALVPMPDAEIWTSFGAQPAKDPVRRIGINLGAAGDRKADDGTLWVEFPSVAGASPVVPIKVVPAEPDWYRRHSSLFSGQGLAWVIASGGRDIRSLSVKLGDEKSARRKYTVRLYFAEPDKAEPGERVFSVSLQGKQVLARLDIAADAGGAQLGITKEFRGIEVTEELRIDLQPANNSNLDQTILSGIEILAEGW